LRKPLSPREIIEIDRALVDVFASHRDIKNRIPAARYIKYPQIPAIFGESVVIAAAGKLYGTD
jgi:hypothetical protein